MPKTFNETDTIFETANMVYELVGSSLNSMIILIISILSSLAILMCFFCFWMKESDRKMKCYLMDMARRRGVKLDMEKLHTEQQPSVQQPPFIQQNCSIIVPDVGIIL